MQLATLTIQAAHSQHDLNQSSNRQMTCTSKDTCSTSTPVADNDNDNAESNYRNKFRQLLYKEEKEHEKVLYERYVYRIHCKLYYCGYF